MRYLLLLLLIPLASCTTLSEDQCRAGDWYAIGVSDGAKGRLATYINKHATACADYGIRPDPVLWEKGRREGLTRYCLPETAWSEGARGHQLSPVCPAVGLAQLERANFRGRTYYRIGQDIAEAERDIRAINSTLAKLPAGSPERASLIAERAALRLEIVSLRAERGLYRY